MSDPVPQRRAVDLPPRGPLTIAQAAVALRDGRLTAAALTERVLERADRDDGWLGCYLCRFDATALERAREADRELAAGRDRGPLHGIPVGVKDIFAAREGPTTAQSLVLDRAWGAGRDAVAVERLREAGAVIVGKTSTMEFAIGMPEPARPFPVPVNPWRRDRWPGGSSSGSASGIVAGLFLGAMGSDTGGSIRIPAAHCGITGLMPTFGRVPTAGCVPLAYSLDHVGPLARTAWDCAAMLAALAGPHPADPESAAVAVPDYLASIGDGIEGLRVGVVREGHLEGARSQVIEVFEAAVSRLGELGATVSEVALPLHREMVAAWMVTLASEACAYHRPDLATRWGDYTSGARTRLAAGVLVSGADYVQAQRVRRLGQRRLAELLASVDVIVAPTVSEVAPPLEGAFDPPHGARVHTMYWDLVGNPVIALPIGFVDGLPVGMQVAAAPFAESTLLRLGHAFQQHSDWHAAVPDLEVIRG